MHPKRETTNYWHPGYQNQPSQHNRTRTKLQKTSPNNCYQQRLNEWWETYHISIRLSLHIFSRINNYLPAFRICLLINTQTSQQTSCMTTFYFFSLSLIACINTCHLLTLQLLHNYPCNILEGEVGDKKTNRNLTCDSKGFFYFVYFHFVSEQNYAVNNFNKHKS